MVFGQNQSLTFSQAAAVAPIMLWNSANASEGIVYAAAQNTFLEFYSDERKAIKHSAMPRSASADSHFKMGGKPRSGVASSTATRTPATTPTNRSTSPSNRSGSTSPSNRGEVTVTSDTMGTDTMPRMPHTMSCADVPSCGKQADMMMPRMPHTMSWADVTDLNEPKQEVHTPKVVPPPASINKSERLTAKKQDLKSLSADEPTEEVTTLMVRGVPCSFSQDTLMQIIDDAGLKKKFDFFYLPRARNNGSNLGYAFINFVDKESAEFCTNRFNGVPLDAERSMKICTISPGDIQGLGNLQKHFHRTAVSRGCRGPVFMKGTSPANHHSQ